MELLRSSEEEAKRSSLKLHTWPHVSFDIACSGGAPEYSSSSSAKIDHSLTKENLSPCVAGSSLSSRIRHPLRPNSVLENLPESTPVKYGVIGLKSICDPSTIASFESQEPRYDDAGNIDSEIEAIEREISRLSLRLECLRLEKAKQIHVKTAAEKRGRFVPAKFMDPPPPLFPGKQNPRKFEESASARKITPRSRGLSMVPSEIARGLNMAAAATPVGRRGISLCPAEIYSATRSRQLAKQQAITPVYQSQSRRKSCFWKLQEVDELKVIKERGKSMSMSPKSRKTASKLMAAANPKMAVTSLGAAKNKSLKKEEGIITSIQPKKLFKDGDKSVPAKKPLKPGRMVASRYNKSSNGGTSNVADSNSSVSSSVRKRSLPEENDKEIKICDNKRISLSDKSEAVSEISLKQSSEVSAVDDPLSVVQELEMLPKIRTLQCLNESPRDSGPAKRVIELVRRRSHFSLEEDERGEEEEDNDNEERVQPTSACKVLSFEDEEEEEKMLTVNECLNIKTFPRIGGNSPRDSGAAKRVSELVGRKSYFSSEEEHIEEEISGCQRLSFEEED